MIEFIFTLLSFLLILILGKWAKRVLYVHEHEESINNELDTFNSNIQAIHQLEQKSDYTLGSGHIYE